MAIYPMLLLLIVPGQDKPKPDTPEDRAKRAAIVDAIMAQPMILKPRIEKPDEEADRIAAVQQQRAQQAAEDAARARAQIQVRVLNRQGGGTRTLTLEAITANVDKPQPGPDGPDDELGPPEPLMPIAFNLNNAVLERENFDRWIFGDGIDEEGRRTRLQSTLSEKIDRVMKDHEINPAQLRKLRLAGVGDIKRFLDRVEEWRPEFEVARKNFNAGRMLLQELEPLSTEFQNGPFGEDSFFAKTLKKIEDDSKATSKGGQ